ncbi:MAG: host attachment protein [Chromatiaceae bacterium]|nr:host attachment protein [Chromatiaceae bacterium]
MNTWVVVASAARARVFEASGRHTPWEEVMDLVNTDDRQMRREFSSDKPGRVVDSSRGQRHTLDAAVDPKEQAAERFAREVVGQLQAGLQDRRFESLCVVAAPHFLGLLRQNMADPLARTVKDELAKDLTREDAGSLHTHVADLLWA